MAAGAEGSLSRPLEEEAEERIRDSHGDDRCIDGGWVDEENGEEDEAGAREELVDSLIVHTHSYQAPELEEGAADTGRSFAHRVPGSHSPLAHNSRL